MNSRLADVARAHRRMLLLRDRETAEQMVRAYQPTHVAIQAQLERINSRIEDAVKEGKPLGKSWLFQQGRAQALEEQIQRAVAGFTPQAERLVVANQRYGVSKGVADSRDLVATAVGPELAPSVLARWDVLPRSAVESLVGFTADGSPLRELLEELGPRTSRAIRDELATGLALGRNPRKVARAVRDRSGMALGRALTISRTEMLRSYRESSRRSYQTSQVVQGWIWLSARQLNTCAACWALDGQRFGKEHEFEGHPNCRCVMVPDTGSTDVGNGPDTFGHLSEAEKKRVLGPGKYKAMQEGEIELGDLVAKRESPAWGTSHSEGGLLNARRRAEARRATGVPSEAQGRLPVDKRTLPPAPSPPSLSPPVPGLEAATDLTDMIKADRATHRRLTREWKQKAAGLSEAEETGLRFYASKKNHHIQNMLRGKGPSIRGKKIGALSGPKSKGLDPDFDAGEALDALDKAIDRHALGADTRLYRGFGKGGLGVTTEQFEKGDFSSLVGKSFRDPGYSSTSVDRGVAHSFGFIQSYDSGERFLVEGREMKKFKHRKLVMQIDAKKGQKGFYIPAVPNAPTKEAEFLLPREQEIRVTGVQRRLVKDPSETLGVKGALGEYEEVTILAELV